MVSNTIVRKDVWVQVPHPAPVGGSRQHSCVPHIRTDEVVASALGASDRGVPDAQNAAEHGVAIKTIRRWRRLYQRRGLPRGQAHTRVPCPRCTGAPLDEVAYAELLGWYLGDGHLSLGHRGVWALQIVNDAQYTAVNAHVADLLERVKPQGRSHARLRPVASSPPSRGSTGHACSPSTGEGASTSGRSGSRTGSARSSSGARATSCAGCSTPTAVAPPTGPDERSAAYRSATSTPVGSS
jgi:hypothetical protein